jgi:hypothetical protein
MYEPSTWEEDTPGTLDSLDRSRPTAVLVSEEQCALGGVPKCLCRYCNALGGLERREA